MPPPIAFDWSISLGQLVTAGATVFAILGAAWRLAARFGRMEAKINTMWRWWMQKVHAGGSDYEDC